MKTVEIKIETPRGSFKITKLFDSVDEARTQGYGVWFQHQNYIILGKDNRVHAAVKVG